MNRLKLCPHVLVLEISLIKEAAKPNGIIASCQASLLFMPWKEEESMSLPSWSVVCTHIPSCGTCLISLGRVQGATVYASLLHRCSSFSLKPLEIKRFLSKNLTK